ncbi:MAG: DUF1080 domain-containing protein [Verrucomicrobiota bacterium]
METVARSNLNLVLAILACSLGAHSAEGEKVSLFDGKTLKGWTAPDLSYWTVENEAITATSSEENPCKKNQFLVWEGGEVSDFVLSLSFKVEGGPKANSGIQIRSQLDETGHAVGYQVDISQPTAPWLGAIYDEHGRKMLAARGEKTTVLDDGSFEKESLLSSADLAVASYQPGGWNRCEITAKENRIEVRLNGELTSMVIDRQEDEREFSGILALQLHSGPPMKVQFRDIELRRIHMEP